MATNEVGGEEIPMTGAGVDVDTTDETGDQETNIDDDLYDQEVFGETEARNGDAFLDALFVEPDDARVEISGTTEWKRRMHESLKTRESLLSKVFDRDFRGSFGEKNRKLLRSLRVKENGNLEFTNLDAKPKLGDTMRSYKDVIVGVSKGEAKLATSKEVNRFNKFNKLVDEAKAESDVYSARSLINKTLEEDATKRRAVKRVKEKEAKEETARKDREEVTRQKNAKKKYQEDQTRKEVEREFREKADREAVKKRREDKAERQKDAAKRAAAGIAAEKKLNRANIATAQKAEELRVTKEEGEASQDTITRLNQELDELKVEKAKIATEAKKEKEKREEDDRKAKAKDDSDAKLAGERAWARKEFEAKKAKDEKENKEKEDKQAEDLKKAEEKSTKSEKEANEVPADGDAGIPDPEPMSGEATEEVVNGVKDGLTDIMQNLHEKIVADMKKIFETGDIEIENENVRREINAALELQVVNNDSLTLGEKFDLFDIQIKHWKDMADKEDKRPELKELFENVAKFEGLAKDFVKLGVDMAPEMEETLALINEKVDASDIRRLGRFKKWAKKNMVGLSTGAITVAAFITSIIMAARDALKVAAKGVGRFAKAVYSVLKQMGPIFSALGDIVSTALSFGAKGVEFLASNLWVLAVAVAAALYGWYNSRGSTPPTPVNTYQNYPETQQTSTRRVRNRVKNYV